MGGRRVEVTSQRGSWEHCGTLPRNHSEKRREKRRWRKSEHCEVTFSAFANPDDEAN